MNQRAFKILGAAVLAAGAVTGCTALLGSYDVAATPPNEPDSQTNPDGPSVGFDGSSGDGSIDAPIVCKAPEVACNGGCAILATSGAHCGKCGRSCGGGACTAGVCSPFKVYDGTLAVGSIDVGSVDAFFAATDGNSNKLLACPKSGCNGAPRQIAQMGYPVRTVTVVPKGTVVFESAPTQATERPALYACPTAGCAAVPDAFVSAGLSGFEGRLRTRADRIFFEHLQSGLGWSTCAPAAGTCDAPNFLANTKGTHGFAADARYLYFIDSATRLPATPSTISICAQDAAVPCNPTTLVPGTNADVEGLVVEGGKLYWLKPGRDGFNEGKLLSCDLPGCATVNALANTLDFPNELIVDSSGVYWLTRGTKLQRCLPNACVGGPRDFAESLDGAHSLVADDAFVYWAEKASVWRLAK